MCGKRCSTTAPRPSSRSTSSSIGPGARKSKCPRFLAVLGSGTWLNQMLGPPQPAASTKALPSVESSSTSDPRTAAQNRASAGASAASNDTDLITAAILATLSAAVGGKHGDAVGSLGCRD